MCVYYRTPFWRPPYTNEPSFLGQYVCKCFFGGIRATRTSIHKHISTTIQKIMNGGMVPKEVN